MWVLSREEVAAALEHRIAQIDASHRASEFAVESIFEHPHKPDHVAEILRLADARGAGRTRLGDRDDRARPPRRLRVRLLRTILPHESG